MSLHNNIVTLPDGSTTTLSSPATTSGYFRIGQSNVINNDTYTKVRIYSVKLYNSSGTLLRDCIPVRDLNGQAKLYDLKSKAYMYDSGNLHGGPVKEVTNNE